MTKEQEYLNTIAQLDNEVCRLQQLTEHQAEQIKAMGKLNAEMYSILLDYRKERKNHGNH